MRKTFKTIIFLVLCCSMATAVLGCNANRQETNVGSRAISKLAPTDKSIFRLSKIEIYPEFLAEYTAMAVEVGAASMQTEPGVLAMYGVAEKGNPCKITILEIYADADSYKSHIASAHFQKYKTGTLKMVKSLELVDQTPLNSERLLP